MLSQLAHLLDIDALVVVLLGTLLATFARCGGSDMRAAAGMLLQLGRTGFSPGANRAALARAASAIRLRGPLCAETEMPPDPSIAELVRGFLIHGSLPSLREAARGQRIMREVDRSAAQRPFEYAGELAPVFGLVGTLFAITQLTPDAQLGTAETTMASVATAVLSSLYGVLSAHLVYFPIARVIERRGEAEEAARASMLDWFEAELSGEHDRKVRGLRDVA